MSKTSLLLFVIAILLEAQGRGDELVQFKDFEMIEPTKLQKVLTGVPSIRDQILNYGLSRGVLLQSPRLTVKNIKCPYSCNFDWQVIGQMEGNEEIIGGTYIGQPNENNLWFAITFSRY